MRQLVRRPTTGHTCLGGDAWQREAAQSRVRQRGRKSTPRPNVPGCLSLRRTPVGVSLEAGTLALSRGVLRSSTGSPARADSRCARCSADRRVARGTPPGRNESNVTARMIVACTTAVRSRSPGILPAPVCAISAHARSGPRNISALPTDLHEPPLEACTATCAAAPTVCL
jgi:hypothetical protein